MGLLGAFADPQFRKDVVRGLLDAGNRGAVAGLLGGPVDLATMALRPLGYNVEQPVGGSEWIGQKMQNLGLVSEKRNPLAEGLAAFAGPMAAQQIAPKVFAAELRAMENMAKPSPMNAATRGQAGAIVWHGSPHKFDKFDSSKIGTGEGAQAYGHGLYLAESPDVATRYRDTLTNFRPDHIEAKLVEAGISPEFANTYSQFAAQTKGGARGLDDFAELMSKPGPSPYIEQFRQRIRAELPAARAAGNSIGGSLYKVDLPDDQIARMLDWDAPLSKQAPGVQQALQSMVGDVAGSPNAQRASRDIGRAFNPYNRADLLDEISKRYGWKVQGDTLVKPDGSVIPESAIQNQLQQRQRGKVYDTAGDLYRDLAQVQGSDASISAVLRQQGVPGVRYLDGGSRGAGAGTSNYVVFPGNENLLRILERNGQALP